jgi:hypothetical protein
MSEVIRYLNSEQVLFSLFIPFYVGTIIHGYKTGVISLIIIQGSGCTFSRDDSPHMFWATIAFYVMITLWTVSFIAK